MLGRSKKLIHFLTTARCPLPSPSSDASPRVPSWLGKAFTIASAGSENGFHVLGGLRSKRRIQKKLQTERWAIHLEPVSRAERSRDIGTVGAWFSRNAVSSHLVPPELTRFALGMATAYMRESGLTHTGPAVGVFWAPHCRHFHHRWIIGTSTLRGTMNSSAVRYSTVRQAVQPHSTSFPER